MKDCVFCDKEKIKPDVIYEQNGLFVKVGLGIVAPGHVMIVSDEHLSCFGEMPDSLCGEYERLSDKLKWVIRQRFSDPLLVEYGIWCQSVAHAHTHFLPHKGEGYNIENVVQEMIVPSGADFEETDMEGVKGIFRQEGRYFSVEEKGRLYVCHVNGLDNDTNNPHPYLCFRPFLKQRGTKVPRKWSKMTEEDKRIDEERREITKRALVGSL